MTNLKKEVLDINTKLEVRNVKDEAIKTEEFVIEDILGAIEDDDKCTKINIKDTIEEDDDCIKINIILKWCILLVYGMHAIFNYCVRKSRYTESSRRSTAK